MKKYISVFLCLLLAFHAFCGSVKMKTEKNGNKEFFLDSTTGTLTVEHIFSKASLVSFDMRSEEVKKVVFNFVHLECFDGSFWDLISQCQILVFNFSTCEFLEFLQYFQELRAISFLEGNTIKNLGILDFSCNQKIEYAEFSMIDFSSLADILHPPHTLKYFVISGSRLKDTAFTVLDTQLPNNTTIVMSAQLSKQIKVHSVMDQAELPKLWKQFDIQ
ncbi:MAG: hypothetical protein K2J50_01085 [Treponemataceae bacterium]|nr:hypothetical protein [Treponemataceae bacterium]